MRLKFSSFLWGAAFFVGSVFAQQTALSERAITLNGEKIVVELAQTPESRERGLMNRFPLPDGRGMLFVFAAEKPLAFWMKNTPAPLSIAFIDKNGIILNIEDMIPMDEQTLHTSHGAALYALEVRRGWFADQNIKAGDAVKNLPAPAKH